MNKSVRWFVSLGVAALAAVSAGCATADDGDWARAEANARQARPAWVFCWRYAHGWMQFADPATGLLPRRLGSDAFWNAQDCAADNYPFMTLTTRFLEPGLFENEMHRILETEQRLCNRVDRLPDDYDFATKAFRTPAPDMDKLIFGASEYVKDGLLPLTEWLGPSPWSQRMLDLLDDIWKNAAVEAETGRLPSVSHEVCGDLLQGLSRCYWMTGKPEYKEWAFRIAAYFLEHHLPTQESKLTLDDHGCEVINGLSEAYLIAATEDSARHAAWRAPMHAMLDRILEVGRDANGLFHMQIDPLQGTVLNEELTDNWGYDYNAFAVVAQLDGVDRFRDAVTFVLAHLPAVNDYPWERDGADGLADSLESGINLINRFPVPEAVAWADHTAGRLLAKQRDTGVIEGWYGDGNSARTMMMYALWKAQGAHVEPWRADVAVGAAVDAAGFTCFTVTADWPWRGKLVFDRPRHREYFHMPWDYPRLNQFQEWFTAAEDQTFDTDGGTLSGAELRAGLDVTTTPDQPYRIRLKAR